MLINCDTNALPLCGSILSFLSCCSHINCSYRCIEIDRFVGVSRVEALKSGAGFPKGISGILFCGANDPPDHASVWTIFPCANQFSRRSSEVPYHFTVRPVNCGDIPFSFFLFKYVYSPHGYLSYVLDNKNMIVEAYVYDAERRLSALFKGNSNTLSNSFVYDKEQIVAALHEQDNIIWEGSWRPLVDRAY